MGAEQQIQLKHHGLGQLAGHLGQTDLQDPPKEVEHFGSPPALAGHLDPPSEQAFLDLPGEAGHGVYLDPLAGDGVNRSWKACMALCEGTCSSVPSFCSAWSQWYR